MYSIIRRLGSYYTNHIGWKTDRKIIIFESDDWGSIRMKSRQTITSLEKRGIIIKDPYNLFDSLASEDDLQLLFELLLSHKDKNENHPIITANTIVANPDFNKIQESGFKQFHYELFPDTLKKYPEHHNSFNLWKKGIEERIFKPQFHGRDHVNINYWLKSLNDKNKNVKIAFDNEIFGLRTNTGVRTSFMRALDFSTDDELAMLRTSLEDGIEIFRKIFGFYSKSFIAPSYVWSNDHEYTLHKNKIKYIQGINYQYVPKVGRENLNKILHYTGQRNKYDQMYLVRNAFFEPSLSNNKIIDETLKRINIAFDSRKPAIVGTHRLNYIGFINKKNRDENLSLFSDLLKSIIKKWPDVEFMTSDQLGDLIAHK